MDHVSTLADEGGGLGRRQVLGGPGQGLLCPSAGQLEVTLPPLESGPRSLSHLQDQPFHDYIAPVISEKEGLQLFTNAYKCYVMQPTSSRITIITL